MGDPEEGGVKNLKKWMTSFKERKKNLGSWVHYPKEIYLPMLTNVPNGHMTFFPRCD